MSRVIVRTTLCFAAVLTVSLFASLALAADDELAAAIDTDKNGKISDEEASKAVDFILGEANAKETSELGKKLLSALDSNKDKKLDQQEATAGVVNVRSATPEGKRVQEVFEKLDANKDRTVSKGEFEKLGDVMDWGKNFRRRNGRLFGEFDTNSDGKINATEAHMHAGLLGPRFGGRGGGPGGRGAGGNESSTAATPKADALRKQIEDVVAKLDRDKDKKLSEREYKGNKDLKARARQMDLDLDEELTVDEIYAFYEAHKAEQK